MINQQSSENSDDCRLVVHHHHHYENIDDVVQPSSVYEVRSVSHQESDAILTIIVDDITEQCDINSHQMEHHRLSLVEASQSVDQSEDLPKASSYIIQMVLSDDQQPIATDVDDDDDAVAG